MNGSLVYVLTSLAGQHIGRTSSWERIKSYLARKADPMAGLDVVTLADLSLKRVRYLWAEMIPVGSLTLMPGVEGIGKSTFQVRLAADLTKGLLPGEYFGKPQHIVILALEDQLESVVLARYQFAGADLARVHVIRAAIDEKKAKVSVIIPRDLDKIARAVRHYQAPVVIIDSFVTTLPDEVKTISYSQVAKVLKAVGDWAEERRVAVLAPWHLNKSAGADPAVKMMDSRAFRTSVRTVIYVVSDPELDEEAGEFGGVVAVEKTNGGILSGLGYRYRLRQEVYQVADEEDGVLRPGFCAVAEWNGTLPGGRRVVMDIMSAGLEKDDGARGWLRDYLTGKGPTLKKDLVAEAKLAGFSESAIERAARVVGVASVIEKGSKGLPFKVAVWSLKSAPHTQTDGTDGTAPAVQ